MVYYSAQWSGGIITCETLEWDLEQESSLWKGLWDFRIYQCTVLLNDIGYMGN
jgi:hypothetical protein